MKRAGNLYLNIHSTTNLTIALRRALRGKRKKSAAIRFLSDCRKNIRQLQERLASRTWFPGNYNTFTIHEPKERLITAAPFEDRIAHHAVMNIVEPYFERFSINDSYACRKGKGLHKAIGRAMMYQKSFPWFLKLDIRKYFDSIDHAILKSLLDRRFKDPLLLELFTKIIDSAAATPGRGLPIGNLTSQHFANFYLGHLDHYIKDDLGMKAYVRYMDDFCVWGCSKEQLREVQSKIEHFLANRLLLRLKHTATCLFPVRYGLPFLGFRLFPHTIRMNRVTLRRFVRTVRKYDHDVRMGLIDARKASESLQSVYAFVRTAHSNRFLQNFATRFAA